jgi:regulator of protease activity HflC (stomatin/prohibitin superfamily)
MNTLIFKNRKSNLITTIALLAISLSLSSCWDFNRQQEFKDAENRGRSTLVEAESSKKAMIEQAKAENESATLQAEAKVKIAKAEAQAEIERAKGVAEANRIIGESMKGNSEYLQYLKIDAIRTAKGDKIYIPTESLLPITEAKK